MFRWIREAFGHKPGGVHTRIATFRPKAPPPDPRAIDVEFTGRELYSFPEGTTERMLEESRALGVRMEMARRAFEAPYGTMPTINYAEIEARVFAHMAEEHDADRFDAASL